MSKGVDKFSFWKKIRFKYKISVFNENTLEEVWGLRLSKLLAFVYTFAFSTALVLITSVIIIKTPIRNYLPGYLNSEMRGQIITNALMLDSLEQVLASQTYFLNHVGVMLKGEVELDSIRSIDSIVRTDLSTIHKSRRESLFVKEFEEKRQYRLLAFPPASTARELKLFFAKPVKGEIRSPLARSHGIDIAVADEQPVLAVQQGTVVYAGYDAEDWYVIQVQHKMGFLTAYKRVSSLLKKTGDHVEIGEAVAIMHGGTTENPALLHFELWQNGESLNPQDYIVF